MSDNYIRPHVFLHLVISSRYPFYIIAILATCVFCSHGEHGRLTIFTAREFLTRARGFRESGKFIEISVVIFLTFLFVFPRKLLMILVPHGLGYPMSLLKF